MKLKRHSEGQGIKYLQKKHALHRNLSRGGLALALLVAASLLVLACWSNILLMLAFEYYHITGHLPPFQASLVTTKESLLLVPFNQAVTVSVINTSPDHFSDDHSLLVTPQNGRLEAVTNDQQEVFNADQAVYLTYRLNNPYSYAKTISVRRRSDGGLLWQYSFNSSSFSFLNTLQDGILFLGVQQESGTNPFVLYAFSEQHGTLLWSHCLAEGFRLTVSNNSVYVWGTQSIQVFAMHTGQALWSTHMSKETTAFTVDNANIYLLNKTLQALRVSDGQQVWNTKLPPNSYFQLFPHILGVQGTTVYLVAGTNKNMAEVLAVRRTDGKTLWDLNVAVKYRQQFEQGFESDLRVNQFTLVNDTVYWLINNTLYAFRGSDGKQMWHVQVGKIPTYDYILVSKVLGQIGDVVYVQSGKEVIALQKESGRVLWSSALPSLTELQAVIIGQTILYGYATHITNRPPPSRFPIILSQPLPPYICQNTFFIFALHAQDGTVEWNKHYQVDCGT